MLQYTGKKQGRCLSKTSLTIITTLFCVPAYYPSTVRQTRIPVGFSTVPTLPPPTVLSVYHFWDMITTWRVSWIIPSQTPLFRASETLAPATNSLKHCRSCRSQRGLRSSNEHFFENHHHRNPRSGTMATRDSKGCEPLVPSSKLQR
jgi:hypothetical protein